MAASANTKTRPKESRAQVGDLLKPPSGGGDGPAPRTDRSWPGKAVAGRGRRGRRQSGSSRSLSARLSVHSGNGNNVIHKNCFELAEKAPYETLINISSILPGDPKRRVSKTNLRTDAAGGEAHPWTTACISERAMVWCLLEAAESSRATRAPERKRRRGLQARLRERQIRVHQHALRRIGEREKSGGSCEFP
jgi:hypothetical protein